MSETKQIEGTVSAVSHRADGYGVKIGEDWFNGNGMCPVSKGARVVINFYEEDGWKTVGSIRSLIVQAEVEVTDEVIDELQQKIRQRNYAIAEQSIEDARRLLASSGLENAVTPQNVVRFAERLAERRILHASRFIDEYVRKKRLDWKSTVQKSNLHEPEDWED